MRGKRKENSEESKTKRRGKAISRHGEKRRTKKPTHSGKDEKEGRGGWGKKKSSNYNSKASTHSRCVQARGTGTAGGACSEAQLSEHAGRSRRVVWEIHDAVVARVCATRKDDGMMLTMGDGVVIMGDR